MNIIMHANEYYLLTAGSQLYPWPQRSQPPERFPPRPSSTQAADTSRMERSVHLVTLVELVPYSASAPLAKGSLNILLHCSRNTLHMKHE
jgi:hypothetical protein